jgi:valyl-tRNA synthetase
MGESANEAADPRADLFENGVFLLAPSLNCPQEAVRLVSDICTLLDVKQHFVDPAEYDGMIAGMDGLPLLMQLAHPFITFITEEIWQSVDHTGEEDSIMISRWPVRFDERIDDSVEQRMSLLQQLIGAIRNIRGEMNVPPGKKIKVVLRISDAETTSLVNERRNYVAALARVEDMTISPHPTIPKPSAKAFLPGVEVHVPLAGLIDLEKENERLRKELNRVEAEALAHEKKLGNDQFVSKAPEHVVQSTRERRDELLRKAEKLRQSLEQLHAS